MQEVLRKQGSVDFGKGEGLRPGALGVYLVSGKKTGILFGKAKNIILI